MSLTARVSLPPHPLVQALHAEWTKLRTVAGPFWLLAGVVALKILPIDSLGRVMLAGLIAPRILPIDSFG